MVDEEEYFKTREKSLKSNYKRIKKTTTKSLSSVDQALFMNDNSSESSSVDKNF